MSALLSYGEWTAYSDTDGTVIGFDDLWFDESGLNIDDCANWATGMWTYAYGAFKLNPVVDGFPAVNCAVATDEMTMDSVKALFR